MASTACSEIQKSQPLATAPSVCVFWHPPKANETQSRQTSPSHNPDNRHPAKPSYPPCSSASAVSSAWHSRKQRGKAASHDFLVEKYPLWSCSRVFGDAFGGHTPWKYCGIKFSSRKMHLNLPGTHQWCSYDTIIPCNVPGARYATRTQARPGCPPCQRFQKKAPTHLLSGQRTHAVRIPRRLVHHFRDVLDVAVRLVRLAVSRSPVQRKRQGLH